MKFPDDLKYTASHEWARLEADGSIAVGITDHAQEALGDIVFVEAPEPGRKLAKGESCGVVESVKAASDIYAPVSGTVTARNEDLGDAPEKVNADAYAAWMYRLKPDNPAELASLLDAGAYEKIASED